MADFPDPASASGSASTATSTSPTSRPTRKRRRPAVVCAECRRRKIACDRKTPCGQCALHNVKCVYVTGAVPPPYGRPARQLTSPVSQGPPLEWLKAAVTDAGRSVETHDTFSLTGDMAGNMASLGPILGERPSRFGGRLAKTRLFGRTHWMNNMDQFKDIHAVTHLVHLVSGSMLHKSMKTCKRLAQGIKAEQQRRILMPPQEGEPTWFTPPPRLVCDCLVELYFNVFESVFRVLHMPTFRREYAQFWDGNASVTAPSDVFMATLILVLALGSCFYDGPESLQDGLCIAATRAVQRLEAASCAPLDKHQLTLDRVQLYCLVMIARQTAALDMGDDLIWFSIGSLLHTAFGMGLNRDPGHFKSLSLSPLQCELRRRLWATILELVVQSGLDQGMPPLISTDDYDCLPPTNLDDAEIEDGQGGSSDDRLRRQPSTVNSPKGQQSHKDQKGHPDSVFTQTSMQRLLFRSLPCRLKIAKTLNGLGPELSYERTLQLSTDLLETSRYAAVTLRSAPLMVDSATVDPQKRASFARLRILFYELLTRRFHHSLHSPFARKAATNVQYFYSRRARIESAVKILSMFRQPSLDDFSMDGSDRSIPRLDDSRRQERQYTNRAVADPCGQLALIGRGLVKCTLVDMGATVAIEMILQVQEDFLPGSDLSMSQRELYGTARTVLAVLRARIEAGETNVKSYAFFAGGLAQIDALMEGRTVRQDITDTVRSVAEQAAEMLRALAVRRGMRLSEELCSDDVDGTSALTISPVALHTEEVIGLGDASLSGMVNTALFSDLETGSADVDSGVHLPSTDISPAGSSSDTWTDHFIVNPQDDFGAGNWFYPYNDCIGGL